MPFEFTKRQLTESGRRGGVASSMRLFRIGHDVMTSVEIAERLGIPVDDARKRIKSARKRGLLTWAALQ